MAPGVGPTSALAMCAAAFVGWHEIRQAQMSESEADPMDTTLAEPNTHASLSSVDISDAFSESILAQEHTWQHQNTTSKTIGAHELGLSDDHFVDVPMDNEDGAITGAHELGLSDDHFVDGPMDNVWKHEDGAVEFTHYDNAVLSNTSIPVDHDMFSPSDGGDDVHSFFNSDSKKEKQHFDYESFIGLLDGSGFDEQVCPQELSESVKKSESHNFAESKAIIHNDETVSDVPHHSSDVLDTRVGQDVGFATKMVSEVSQYSNDVSDARAGQDTVGLVDDVIEVPEMKQAHHVKNEASEGQSTEGHNQSSIFQGKPEEFLEFLLAESRKVFSDENLEKVMEVLHQQWHSFLAFSRSVLGEEMFLRVSDVTVRYWQVVLLCFASLCDVVLFGVFGRFLLRSIASFFCRHRRKEPVPAELPSDEQSKTAQSNSGSQVLTSFSECESACEGRSVEMALTGQCKPFKSISVRNIETSQVHKVPTPTRGVLAGNVGFASGQNMAATSVSAEIA